LPARKNARADLLTTGGRNAVSKRLLLHFVSVEYRYSPICSRAIAAKPVNL